MNEIPIKSLFGFTYYLAFGGLLFFSPMGLAQLDSSGDESQFEVIDLTLNNNSEKEGLPEFESTISSIKHFNGKFSDFLPTQVSTAPNDTLTHVVVRSDSTSTIKVIGEEAEGDEFEFYMEDSEHKPTKFVADYGRFGLYAFDLDGDSTDEILIELGRGRGTACHERYLAIYEFNSDSGYSLAQEIQLSGWLDWNGKFHRSWDKSYSFKKKATGYSIHLVSMP